MTPVTPKVFSLAEPTLHLGTDDDPGVIQWLKHVGGQEALSCLDHMEGSDIEQIIMLGCWCKPRVCHCDTYAAIADWKLVEC